jgi:hypothetical protein
MSTNTWTQWHTPVIPATREKHKWKDHVLGLPKHEVRTNLEITQTVRNLLLMSVIIATLVAEIRRITFRNQPGKIDQETLSLLAVWLQW